MPKSIDSTAVELPSGPVLVTRRLHFCAAHRLHNPEESEEWNSRTFGLCNNEQWHGHNYELEVSVVGNPDPRTGYLIDLKELKDLVEEKILKVCDHRNLNQQVPFLDGIIPTAENLVKAFWAVLDPFVSNSQRRLYQIRLLETPRNIAEYRGPSGYKV
ncbi:MAG: 6-carboxytetrahydropterin synthase [Opitutales bacterium]|nr:6-carboxytetrahydropterin synthase [Opitutales bacterium]